MHVCGSQRPMPYTSLYIPLQPYKERYNNLPFRRASMSVWRELSGSRPPSRSLTRMAAGISMSASYLTCSDFRGTTPALTRCFMPRGYFEFTGSFRDLSCVQQRGHSSGKECGLVVFEGPGRVVYVAVAPVPT